MVVFINTLTGTEMLVADSRVDEYKAAGYKTAAEIGTIANNEETVEKKTTKKTTKRK